MKEDHCFCGHSEYDHEQEREGWDGNLYRTKCTVQGCYCESYEFEKQKEARHSIREFEENKGKEAKP